MSPLVKPIAREDVVRWLHDLAGTLDKNLQGEEREQALVELRRDADSPRGTLPTLASLALIADCLHVVQMAVLADGVVEDSELERVGTLVAVAASRYAGLVPGYEQFDAADVGSVKEFLRNHGEDRGPFGYGAGSPWRGLALCRRVASAGSNMELLDDYERVLVRLMEDVFAGADSKAERTARRRLRELLDRKPQAGVDPRAVAYCRVDGPEIFSSISYGSQIAEPDRFDVPAIHAEARTLFQQQVERSVSPASRGGHGRIMLVRGHAGAGKTHLMRAFRAQLHRQRLGYAAYLQLTSEVGDYARYVLANVVDSLERPYFSPELDRSALLYLSDGLAENSKAIDADDLERLRMADLGGPELSAFVGKLVDRVLRVDRLSGIDSDLVQALLLVQRRDAAIQKRVVKFLRCENLNGYEQELLGALTPRIQPEDPQRTLGQLAKLMSEVTSGALVLLVDQIEDVVLETTDARLFQRAMDVIRGIADASPSTLVVLSCLDDVYHQFRGHLSSSLVDRLERDPAPVVLQRQRNRVEVESMLNLRLQHLFETFDVAWREHEPFFPFKPEQVDAVVNHAARECLASFKKHHDACIAAGHLVDVAAGAVTSAQPPLDAFDRIWNDCQVTAIIPDDDEAVLGLIGRSLEDSATELSTAVQVKVDYRDDRALVTITAPKSMPPRLLGMCNARAQGGGLGNQVEALGRALPPGAVPVILRTSDFSFGDRTKITKQLGEVVGKTGMKLQLPQNELRSMTAMLRMREKQGGAPGFADWRRRVRPLSQLGVLRSLLGISEGEGMLSKEVQVVSALEPAPPLPARKMTPPAEMAPPPPPVVGDLRIGATLTMRADPVCVTANSLVNHAAFLGTTGSGKTTLALHVVEQLLERGVSCLLVDRKGDLARYASTAWWDEVPADPDTAARKKALRARVKVSLFTPGDPNGRPLRLLVIPPGMASMSTADRNLAARSAAVALGAMMGYKANGENKTAILHKAIEVNADGGATLDHLRDTINQPDPRLLAEVNSLVKYFPKVAEDLDTLAISRGPLLRGDGEVLDLAKMLGGKQTNLVIVSAHALFDDASLQFWVSRLLVDLARWVRSAPTPHLQAAAFFDEADRYIPATSEPATKAPMFELLRRARSMGLGIFVASQSPADFDYRARDLINTWFVGKLTQERAVEKMRWLLGEYPNVAARLAAQKTGSFFLLRQPPACELRADLPLMKTEQLAEHEVAALAREQRAHV